MVPESWFAAKRSSISPPTAIVSPPIPAAGRSTPPSPSAGSACPPASARGCPTTGSAACCVRGSTDAQVDQTAVVTTPDPTSLAVVTLNERGEAEYQFYVEGTADRGLPIEDLPSPSPDSVRALHFGTLSLVLEPGACTYEHLMRREHGRRLLALDPNCRPRLIPDRDGYRRRLEGWVALMRAGEGEPGRPDLVVPRTRPGTPSPRAGTARAPPWSSSPTAGRGATGYLGDLRCSRAHPDDRGRRHDRRRRHVQRRTARLARPPRPLSRRRHPHLDADSRRRSVALRRRGRRDHLLSAGRRSAVAHESCPAST